MQNIEKVLKIKLNKDQKKHIESLRWFLNDGKKFFDKHGNPKNKNRQTGRSDLTLMLIIEKALENRDENIPIVDHYIITSSRMINSHIKYNISRLKVMLHTAGIVNYTIDKDYYKPCLNISSKEEKQWAT